jgi:DNA-binding NarL/FixJ family response regulator
MSHPSPRIRVLIIDDHTVVRTGLHMLIETNQTMQVVGEAANSTEALEIVRRERPHIIVLDLMLRQESGLDLLPLLRETAPDARVILLTGSYDNELHEQSVRLGAMGVVLKDQASDVLLRAIERVYAGEAWLDPTLTARVLHQIARGKASPPINPEAVRIASLTEREHQVIRLICEGLPNKQIGERMHISETTVRHHLTSIFDKLGLANRLELVIYAYRHQLIAPPQ